MTKVTTDILEKYKKKNLFVSINSNGNFRFSTDLTKERKMKKGDEITISTSEDEIIIHQLHHEKDATTFCLSEVNGESKQVEFKSTLLRRFIMDHLEVKEQKGFRLVVVNSCSRAIRLKVES